MSVPRYFWKYNDGKYTKQWELFKQYGNDDAIMIAAVGVRDDEWTLYVNGQFLCSVQRIFFNIVECRHAVERYISSFLEEPIIPTVEGD